MKNVQLKSHFRFLKPTQWTLHLSVTNMHYCKHYTINKFKLAFKSTFCTGPQAFSIFMTECGAPCHSSESCRESPVWVCHHLWVSSEGLQPVCGAVESEIQNGGGVRRAQGTTSWMDGYMLAWIHARILSLLIATVKESEWPATVKESEWPTTVKESERGKLTFWGPTSLARGSALSQPRIVASIVCAASPGEQRRV